MPREYTSWAPVAASQTRAILSNEAVTMRLPLGENSAEITRSPCPDSTASWAPVTASQMRTVLSSDAVTMRLPSGEYAAEVT